jgi:hypothetical protein
MKDEFQPLACISGCGTPVPLELMAERVCVYHFTLGVERTCAEMHRQIALSAATPERLAEVAIFVDESALVLARVTSKLCLSDLLKKRILSTFLSLMNLRENLDRARNRHTSDRPPLKSYTAARARAAASSRV